MYTFVLVHRKDGSLDFIIRVAQRNIRRYRSRKEGGGGASLCSRGKSEHHWARTLGRIWAPDGGNTRAQRCCTKIHIQRGRRAAYKGEPRPSKYICAYIFSFAVIQSEKSRTNERGKKKKKRKTTKKKRITLSYLVEKCYRERETRNKRTILQIHYRANSCLWHLKRYGTPGEDIIYPLADTVPLPLTITKRGRKKEKFVLDRRKESRTAPRRE